MTDHQKLLAQYARKNRYDELFRSWLEPTRAQALDMKIRDMAVDLLKEIRKL